MNAARGPFRRAANLLRGQAYGAAELDQTIWALKDVSFEVKRGEVVGIIGRNRAGKAAEEPPHSGRWVYRAGTAVPTGTRVRIYCVMTAEDRPGGLTTATEEVEI